MPDMSEDEMEREYRLAQKRGRGEEIVGNEAEELSDKGAPAKVARAREAWSENRERLPRQDF